MTDASKAFGLLTELEQIDVDEDRILAELLRRGAALEELERRGRMVTVAELHALRGGLANLKAAIDALQAGVARAEQAAEPNAKPANGNGGPKGYADGRPPDAPAVAKEPTSAPAPPPPTTFEELAASIREHDAEGTRLRDLLRERFAALQHVDVAYATTTISPGVPYVAPGGGVAKPSDPPRTLRVTTPPMTGGDVAAFQVALKHRFERWEIGLHVDTNGIYDAATRLAARRVARGLGIAPEDLAHGIGPEVRGLIRNPSRRTAEQLRRARENGAWLKALRKRYPVGGAHDGRRHGHATPPRKVPSKPTPRPRPAYGVEAAIRAHGGRYEDVIVRAARAHGVPVSLVCAVIEKESGFRNLFGSDAVANPIKGGVVTEERYRAYLKHRKAGRGAQGVGPAQLTFPGFQDRADKLGGCWKPAVNIKVGVQVLADNIAAHGTRAGVARYNGSGARAAAYADDVLARERKWRTRLAGASPSPAPGPGGSHGPTSPAGPHEPKVYKLTAQPMSGTDIKAFQADLNDRMQRWGIDLRIEEDGVYGPATRTMARRVLRGLGVVPAAYEHGITPELRSLIRNPARRTSQQLTRARANRAWLRALRKRYTVGGGGSGRYPLGKRGKLIGTPHAGTHTLGNWQSDNAVDIGVPVGTTMLALDSGKVIKVRHHPQGAGRFAGDQITIQGDHGNAFFYGHGVAQVKEGQRVHRGQVIGTSGSANGVAHLHLGVRKGDPRQLIGQPH